MKYKTLFLAVILCLSFMAVKADEQSQFDQKWSECKVDSDCIEVEYGFLPVNKKYYEMMKNFVGQNSQALDDLMPYKPHTQICVHNKCETTTLN